MKFNLGRRFFVQKVAATGLAILGASSIGNLFARPAFANVPGLEALIGTDCPSLNVGEGPYYPGLEELPWGSDLTTIPGKSGVATGQLLYVFGQITTSACKPLGNAEVHLWQSDHNGRYNHPTAKRLSQSEDIDHNFRYFGRVKTQMDGYYLFKTIVPKWYTVFGMKRCAHIHFKINHIDYGTVTTQLMFKGKEDDEIRKEDPEYLNAMPHIRDKIVVEKQHPSAFPEMAKRMQIADDALICRFDQSFI